MKALLFALLAGPARWAIRAAPGGLADRLCHAWLRGARNLFHGRTVDVALAGGGRMRVNTHETTHRFIWLFGVWEPAITAYCRAVLKPGDLFVDIGANIGYYSVLAASLGARPLAFEPMPATLERLRENFRLNGMAQADIVARGVSAEAGSATIYDGPPNNAGRATIVEGRGRGAGYTIDLLGVADIAAELKAARLIKIDIEGAERILLPALAPMAPDLTGDLVLEIDPRSGEDYARDVSAALARFEKAGYSLFALENTYSLPFYRRSRYAFRPMRAADVFSESAPVTDLVLSRRTSLSAAGLAPAD